MMDPTIEMLTIYPAAWAALSEGLAVGLTYGLTVVAGIAVAGAALMLIMGGREHAELTLDTITRPLPHRQPAGCRGCRGCRSCLG